MKKKTIQIFIACCFTASMVFSQETIQADITEGCDSLMVQFELVNSRPADKYSGIQWYFGDGASASNLLSVNHAYKTPGIYTVRVILDGARIIEQEKFIKVGETPFAEFTYKDISVSETEFTYSFESAYYKALPGFQIMYTWTFPDGTEQYDSIANYTFAEEDTFRINLLLEDQFGCKDLNSRLIPVSRELMVPNFFSPNGDLINDQFEVTTAADKSYSLSVFTREGLLIYKTESTRIIWDGRSSAGMEVPEGIYYFVIKSLDGDGKPPVSGFVHLFR